MPIPDSTYYGANFSPAPSLQLTDGICNQDAIKVLIEQRFDAINDVQGTEAMPTPPHQPHVYDSAHKHATNGVKHEEEDEDEVDDDISNEINVSTAPSKKRSSSMVESEDARLARELQAQENQLARGRQTRGGHSKPKAKPAKKKKQKSSAKIKAGDDSDLDTEDSGTPKKRKAGGGFMKEFNLSYALQELVGEERVSHFKSVSRVCSSTVANSSLVVPTSSGQKIVGAHQGQRPAGARGQTPNSL